LGDGEGREEIDSWDEKICSWLVGKGVGVVAAVVVVAGAAAAAAGVVDGAFLRHALLEL
jgi:hypothetical protein